MKKIKEPEEIDEKLPEDEAFWNWFAGFWEGEGYIGIQKYVSRAYKDKEYECTHTYLGISNSSLKILEFIKDKLRVGNIYDKEKTPDWTVSSRSSVIAVARKMLPYLKFRKDKVLNILKKAEEEHEEFKRRKGIWTEEEIKFIEENYKNMIDREIAQKLNRSIGAVQLRRERLGLRKPRGGFRR